MKKVLLVSVALLLVGVFASSVMAETDRKAIKKINDIRLGKNTKNAIKTLLVLEDGTVRGNLTIQGDASVVSQMIVAAAMTFSNNIVLVNGETIDNATDAEVRVTYNDDAAVLGTLKLESDNTATSMADDDSFRIDATAFPTNSAIKVTFGRDAFVFTDVTSNTWDGAKQVWAGVAGTLTQIATFDASGITVNLGSFIGNGASITNIPVATGLESGGVLPSLDGSSLTNLTGIRVLNTNVTAIPQIYAPQFIGQFQIGTVSNVYWGSSGLTTNDWDLLN